MRQTVSEDPLDVYVWDLKGSQYSKEAAANWVGLCPAARTDGSGRPVAFSVGNTPSGKGFFSISISHALVDGWSLYWFVRTVADFYSDRLPVPPTNTLATPGLTGVELTPVKMDAPEPANPAPDGKLYCWEQFNRDTANLIRELCRKVSHLEASEVGMHAALTAFFLVMKHEFLVSTAEVQVRTPLNIRGMQEGVDAGFFGNAFVDSVCWFQASELRLSNVSKVAARIHSSLDRTRQALRTQTLFSIVDGGLEAFSEIQNDELFDPARSLVSSNMLNFGSGVLPSFLSHTAKLVVSRISTPRGLIFRSGLDDSISVSLWTLRSEGVVGR